MNLISILLFYCRTWCQILKSERSSSPPSRTEEKPSSCSIIPLPRPWKLTWAPCSLNGPGSCNLLYVWRLTLSTLPTIMLSGGNSTRLKLGSTSEFIIYVNHSFSKAEQQSPDVNTYSKNMFNFFSVSYVRALWTLEPCEIGSFSKIDTLLFFLTIHLI